MESGLLHNVFMLASAALALVLVSSRSKTHSTNWRRHGLLGVVFGGIAAAVILNPISIPPGATFDTRAGPAILVGLFVGPFAAFITAAIGAAARYSVGGSGAIGGAISLFVYAALGCGAAALMPRLGIAKLKPLHLPILGLIGAVAVAPTFFIGQPASVGMKIIGEAWWLLALGNLASVSLLGLALLEVTRIIEGRKSEVIAAQTDRLARAAAGVGVFSIDPATGRMTCDATLSAMMGGPDAPVQETSDSFIKRLKEEHRSRFRERLQTMRNGGERLGGLFELDAVAGSRRMLAINSTIVEIPGDGERLVGACRDITQDLLNEEDLRLKSTALERISHGVIISRAIPGRPMVYVNPSFEQLSGYVASEVIGKACDFMQGPDTDPETVAAISDALRNNRRFDGVIKNYRKSGESFWNQLSITPIDSDGGVTSHFIGVLEDITDEIDARHAAEDLNKSLEAQSALLSEQLRQLDQANEAKSHFLAQMSHELRTPLNAIIGFSELLASQTFGPLGSERYVNYAKDINESGAHLLSVINDVLDMSRLEAGAFTPETEVWLADEIIDASRQVVHGLAEQKTLSLTVEGDDGELKIACDRRATRQILINLLSNAIKFSSAGKAVTITRSVSALDPQMVSISVRDHGPGIPADVLRDIGKPFLQARSSLYADVKGAGLGLSISRSLAEAMGGTLVAEGAPGGGAMLTLHLPKGD